MALKSTKNEPCVHKPVSQPLYEDFLGQVSAAGQNQGLVSTGEIVVLIQATSCHMLAAIHQYT